ncbi:unnamed protein product [Adineta steineri]|uniref:Microbial-type PARG catalytic domain-containing protein n=1 Tax=Adineta steineri TaxID=433720 RepID=A0A819NIU3_9BILA|nr:unnamed protein product [Adineta steineri]CAF3998550.1 unnamed protein product [Adineta steineri]
MAEPIDCEDASSLVSVSRNERARMAQNTLATLQTGWYELPDGQRVNLEDDVKFCNDNSILYTEDDLQNMKKSVSTTDESDIISYPKIEIRYCTTLQAARFLVAEVGEDHVGVLNFASAKNPGGGFLKGSQAQEESIARSSSLYLAETQSRFMNGYYDYNRHGPRGIYSHRMIYSPRVTVFKDDNGKLLSSPYHVAIVTAPAPNAGVIKNAKEARNVMTERVKHVLNVFKTNKHDTLVLGAYGCGVFKNDPLDVALIFRQHLESKEFQHSFKRIIFAILNEEMYQIFEQVFGANDLNIIHEQIATLSLDHGVQKQSTNNNRNKQNKRKGAEKRRRNNHFDEDQNQITDNDDKRRFDIDALFTI